MEYNDFWIGFFWAIVGVLLGLIPTAILLRRVEPKWYFKINYLFSKGVSNIEGLKMSYKDQITYNLSSIYLAFWNNGKKTLTREMIAEKIKFSTAGECLIYDAIVLKSSHTTNNFNLKKSIDGKELEMDFDYLDHKEGAVIQIFTNCENLQEFNLSGKIIECKPFKTISYNLEGKLERFISWTIRILYWIGLFAMICWGIFSIIFLFLDVPNPDIYPPVNKTMSSNEFTDLLLFVVRNLFAELSLFFLLTSASLSYSIHFLFKKSSSFSYLPKEFKNHFNNNR